MFDERTLTDVRQGLKEWETEVIKLAPDLAAKNGSPPFPTSW